MWEGVDLGDCTSVNRAEEGGAMPRLPMNQKRWMEAEGALGRGGCKACWDLSHTGRWGGESDGVPFLPPPAILCRPSFDSHFLPLSRSHCICSPGVKYC